MADSLCLYLDAQNAGILIRHNKEERIIFETFELSASSDSVMSSSGRLIRTFPGRAVSIPATRFFDDAFRVELSKLLSRLNGESIGLYQPISRKAGASMREVRETTHPGMVSDCLMTMLCALGDKEDVQVVQKFVRDDVLWDNALLPWRRAPFWLLLKVSVLRTLLTSNRPVEARKQYKLFMIEVVACTLRKASGVVTEPDLISVVHVKLARRVHKFEQEFGPLRLPHVSAISKEARQKLDALWEAEVSREKMVSRISTNDWESATFLSSPTAREVLRRAIEPLTASVTPAQFTPPSQPRTHTDKLPSLESLALGKAPVVMLAEIESWVERHLVAWTISAISDLNFTPFDDLVTLITDYWSLAKSQYECSPLEKSNALLIILELWVALDKICVSRVPLLRRHSPEITTTLLSPLLLPKKNQMIRLSEIEKHINERRAQASHGATSVFARPTVNSIHVWYYDISPKLQQLRYKIDQHDQVKRQQKLEELRVSSQKYQDLIAKSENELLHATRPGKHEPEHDSLNCVKCRYHKEATAMRIRVDEKSLPNDVVQLKAVVFELAIPFEFAAWRDATWSIIQNIGQRDSQQGNQMFNLAVTYEQLRPFAENRVRQPQLTLGSRTKTFIQAHYSHHEFPTTEQMICVDNALQYDMWGRNSGTWLNDVSGESSFKNHSTLSLPSGSYANLEWALRTTDRTMNQVMALQSECSDSLEIREFIAFGSLRSGERIQWLNILRELGWSNLTLNDPAVTTLMLQASWEAGSPSDNEFRTAHDELRSQPFCNKILEMLRRKLLSIEHNWQEQHSMMTLIQLTLRVLSLVSDESTETVCFHLLAIARRACLDWCRQIQLHMTNNSTRADVQQKAVVQLLSAALLCYGTFDVDGKHIYHVLASTEDVAILGEAQITICDTTPVTRGALPLLLRQSLLHHTIIAHKFESHLNNLLRVDGTGLNQAVQQVWNGAVLQSKWRTVSDDARSWLINQTSPNGSRPQIVHYNLLGGDLLVDGKPVGRLPDDLKTQTLFQQIFGPAILNVFASNLPGMDYAVSQHIHENEIHIGSRSGDVLIRARLGDQMYQAIPQSAFAGQLPSHFVDAFTHWLNEATGEIEFRPLGRPWEPSEKYWRLTFSYLNFLHARSQMRCGSQRLIENQSLVGKSVSDILNVLDHTHHCETIIDDFGPSELKVYLRRYNLHFLVTPTGELLSLEYNSVVDPNQNIGTMVGLQSKLVLIDAVPANGLRERRVVVPWGTVVVAKSEKHVTVDIQRGTGSKQRYFAYSLDRHLQKLRGQQDVLGTLYKAYLHAVTSFILSDPLTGRTGTEESLSTLKEASLFSCTPLDQNEIYVLNLFAALTPSRCYYPQHLKVMQVVQWKSTMSPLAQHDDFLLAAKAIYDHHSTTEPLFDTLGKSKGKMISRGDATLLERARNRNASVMKSGLFSALPVLQDCDSVYPGRDRFDRNERASRVFEVVSLIKEWPSRIPTHDSLTAVVKAWVQISGYNSGAFNISPLQELSTLKFNEHFGSLYELCRYASRAASTVSLMFRFSVIAVGAEDNMMKHIRTLLAFAFSRSFLNIDPPPTERSYNLGGGSSPSEISVLNVISQNLKDYQLPNRATNAQRLENRRQKREQTEQITLLCAKIVSQWPGTVVSASQNEFPRIKTPGVVLGCQRLFTEWHKNRRFLEHIEAVDSELTNLQTQHVEYQMPDVDMHMTHDSPQIPPPLDLIRLFEARAGAVQCEGNIQASLVSLQPMRTLEDASQVKRLVATMSTKADSTHKVYGEVLRASIDALEGKFFDLESQGVPLGSAVFERHRTTMTKSVKDYLRLIHSKLSPSDVSQQILEDADLWPRLSQPCLLAQLSRRHVSRIPEEWKDSLLELAEMIALMQRAERISKFHSSSNNRSLWKELKHRGREGWSAKDHPSWLLLEIEKNITIRPLQAKVAMEMISPSSGRNSVLQLNMGEGKSSVIVPMLVAALADGKRLVRVIVLKPLLRQTEQVLTQCLGGILDQRVAHVPFSRKTAIDSSKIATILDTFTRYAGSCGVMVTLPEELLSMRLMTREKMTTSPTLAAAVLDLYRWLKNSARDILDESDEILSVRSQLIYPVGGQQMLDGKNDRWQITQAVLQRVNLHVKDLAAVQPSELELDYSGKSFPLLKFLRSDVGERLVELLVDDAVNGLVSGLSFDFYSGDTRNAVQNFISLREVSQQDLTVLAATLQKGPHWNAVLILRGLFAHDVLLFALQRKRWLVEYGLDPRRCLMAVPYRAKGVPSTNSEFGHPDVAIILTCLSYYYTGLTVEQMYTCFTILSKDSNPQDVYSSWVSAYDDFPQILKSYEAVNLDDKTMCESKLYPLMQFNLETITFYLNQVVFPKEGKEFSKRISASGWDIPAMSTDASLITTGFSGTNDSRAVLPFAIKQEDLPELQHTNAMVLNLILREENGTYLQSVDADGRKLNIEGLLALVRAQTPRINALIDVGAQVLEATNLELVKQWLNLELDAHAAVYFDDRDEAMVLDRSGSVTPLRISPFSGQLDACLIYLDEVHTRGIDLAIPSGARAAVTLGPRLVKDRLMQACMRLRSLGNGHSLCFIAPPEVHRNICDTAIGGDLIQPTSFDVLAWSMEQTCQSLDIARPLRVMHGLELLRQRRVLEQYLPESLSSAAITSDSASMEQFWDCIQEDDAQKLENLYGINDNRVRVLQGLLRRNSSDETMQHLVGEVNIMSKTLMQDSSTDNEQERELEHEIEKERQVQRPPRVKPLVPEVSRGLKQYIASGTDFALRQCDTENAFKIFLMTTAEDSIVKQFIKLGDFTVLATKDFAYCVELGKGSRLDEYLRPAVWVLSSSQTRFLLIISPHEANELLTRIKASDKVRLHIFAARLSKKMARFNHMKFYTPNSRANDVAPSPQSIRDLELFAGSLYFDNITTYEQLCHFLGIVSAATRPRNRPVHTDGFLDAEIRDEIGWLEDCPFERSPLPFLKQVVSLRMHGQAFSHSHLGALINGRALQEPAFEGCQEIGEILKETDVDG